MVGVLSVNRAQRNPFVDRLEAGRQWPSRSVTQGSGSLTTADRQVQEKSPRIGRVFPVFSKRCPVGKPSFRNRTELRAGHDGHMSSDEVNRPSSARFGKRGEHPSWVAGRKRVMNRFIYTIIMIYVNLMFFDLILGLGRCPRQARWRFGAGHGGVIVVEEADNHVEVVAAQLVGAEWGHLRLVREEAVEIGGAGLANHPGEPPGRAPGEKPRRVARASLGEALDLVALAAFFLERLVTGVFSHAGAVQPLIGGQVVGDPGERRDEIGHVVELLALELRALLPFHHPAQAGDLAEIGGRRGVLEQAANPGSGAEALEVGRGLLAGALSAQEMAAQALLLQSGMPVG